MASHRFEEQRGTFKLELHGVQHTDWSHDNQEEPQYSCRGSGSERISFETPAPVKVKVRMRRSPRFAFPPDRRFNGGPFAVRASVERNATWTATEGCDLETQSCAVAAEVDWWLRLAGFRSAGYPLVNVKDADERNEASGVDAPLSGCWNAYDWFPYLDYVGSFEFFDAYRLFKRGRLTMRECGIEENGKCVGKEEWIEPVDAKYRTELRWTLTLKRVK